MLFFYNQHLERDKLMGLPRTASYIGHYNTQITFFCKISTSENIKDVPCLVQLMCPSFYKVTNKKIKKTLELATMARDISCTTDGSGG